MSDNQFYAHRTVFDGQIEENHKEKTCAHSDQINISSEAIYRPHL